MRNYTSRKYSSVSSTFQLLGACRDRWRQPHQRRHRQLHRAQVGSDHAPLNVLEDCALITREPDLFRAGRSQYRIVEPLITFYEAVMRKRWPELEIHRAETVWKSSQERFLAQVNGPHFEAMCRDFIVGAADTLLPGHPAEVGSGVVGDPANRTQIEIDVAVLAAQQPGQARVILSLGEAKWGEVMGHHHVQRLARARDLLAAKGFDTSETVLACYGGAGFTKELVTAAAADERLLLIGLDQLYARDNEL